MRHRAGRAIVLGLFVAASLAAGWWVRSHWSVVELVRLAGRAGSWARVGFVGLLVIGEALWLPRMALVAAGGLLFGPVAGPLSVVGDLVSATVFFFLGRGALRPWVERQVARRPGLAASLRLVADREGILTVALLRICPVAHYTAFGYACGAWSVRFWKYLAGTAVGLLPGALLYPWLGRAVLEPGQASSWVFVGFLAAFLLGTGWLGRRILAGARKDGSRWSLAQEAEHGGSTS